MTTPPVVLLFGQDYRLLETRQWVLESRGLRVRKTMLLDDMEHIATQEPIDLFLLCNSLSHQTLTSALILLKDHWPTTRSLVLAPVSYSFDFDYAGEVLLAPDGPGQLLATVHHLLEAPRIPVNC